MAPTATRRRLVKTALAATLGASSVVELGSAVAAATPAPSDAAVLAHTLRIEQLVVIAYQRVLSSGVVEPPVGSQLRSMLSQELEHVAALERDLKALGARVPRTSAATAQRSLDAHHVHLSLSHVPTQHASLKLLIDIESLAEGAYFSAISKLSDPALLRMSAEIMGSEAQHWTLLSGLQHHGDVTRSVPYAFVQGSE